MDEQQAFRRRHLVMQTSLDQAMGLLYGEFTGYDWRVIEKAITARADTFPQNTEAEHTTATQRRADALAAICHDTLDESAAGNTGQRSSCFLLGAVQPSLDPFGETLEAKWAGSRAVPPA